MSQPDDIDPNAPAGGGGAGAFRSAGPLGTNPEMDQWTHPGPKGVNIQIQASMRQEVTNTIAHHVVQQGDSLWSIAVRHLGDGRCTNDLARLNKISSQAILRIGTRLIVPNYQRYDLTVAYMLLEMLKNVQGDEAKAISDAINRSKLSTKESDKAIEDMKKAEWYELFRIYGDQQIINSTLHQSGVTMVEAKARWFLQVRQGGPWDHKPMLRKMYESMASPPRPFGSMGKAFHFPVRGDIFHEYYYDIWSNIHYGYVGTKCGFDESTLQGAAASGLPGAGDNDEGDVISIKIGIDLWNNLGLRLDADSLRKAIISHAVNYMDARSREIKQGITADQATNVVISNNDYK